MHLPIFKRRSQLPLFYFNGILSIFLGISWYVCISRVQHDDIFLIVTSLVTGKSNKESNYFFLCEKVS